MIYFPHFKCRPYWTHSVKPYCFIHTLLKCEWEHSDNIELHFYSVWMGLKLRNCMPVKQWLGTLPNTSWTYIKSDLWLIFIIISTRLCCWIKRLPWEVLFIHFTFYFKFKIRRKIIDLPELSLISKMRAMAKQEIFIKLSKLFYLTFHKKSIPKNISIKYWIN